MPIKPENRLRYPKNWGSEIRPAILERAKHCCEICGVANYSVGWFIPNLELTDPLYPFLHLAFMKEFFDKYGDDLSEAYYPAGSSPRRVVLTIMHIDHTPENCDHSNLKAACQRCHNAYDTPHRRKNAAATRAKNKKQTELFAISLL